MPRLSASTRACGFTDLRDEDAAHRTQHRVEVHPLDVARELLDAVDLAAALHFDRDRDTVAVAAQQVDGADVGRMLAAHEPQAGAIAVQFAASSSCRCASTPSFCRPGSVPSS